MKNREEILADINKIIKTEHGKVVTEDSLLTDCEIDSFGYAMLWLGIENEIIEPIDDNAIFGKERLSDLDYETYKVSDVIDRLIEYQMEYVK